MTNSATTDRRHTFTILAASLAGTTIEFFDFYIYANAAVLVFPKLFFPSSDPGAATLNSLLTFALAFIARPVGSAIFGHFGDRVGRKATLVAALLTMGLSTIAIGLLPTYATVGFAAPLLLAACRVGQGLGLGGEWGGAVLLATENAPPGKRAWFGMFPQLGAPLGFLLAGGLFLILSENLDDTQFFAWGWRIPFLASTLLILIGLYVRVKITETPEFAAVIKHEKRETVPVVAVVAKHYKPLIFGTIGALVTFVIFYIFTVFAQKWGTQNLKYTRPDFLRMQLIAILFFAATVPISALIADKLDVRRVLMIVAVLCGSFGFLLQPMFVANNPQSVVIFLAIGSALMGLTYGPLGTLLSELYPPEVRFTGASLCFNLASIFGASLTPYIADTLAIRFGLPAVGYYLAGAAALTLVGLYFAHPHKPAHETVAPADVMP